MPSISLKPCQLNQNFINAAYYTDIQSMLETNGATSSFLLGYLPSELIDVVASKLKLLPKHAILSLKWWV